MKKISWVNRYLQMRQNFRFRNLCLAHHMLFSIHRLFFWLLHIPRRLFLSISMQILFHLRLWESRYDRLFSSCRQVLLRLPWFFCNFVPKHLTQIIFFQAFGSIFIYASSIHLGDRILDWNYCFSRGNQCFWILGSSVRLLLKFELLKMNFLGVVQGYHAWVI